MNYWDIKSHIVPEGVVKKYPLEKLIQYYAAISKNILDFGAGDLQLEKKICCNTYDPCGKYLYDYTDISQIKETFDLILCLQVIEHIGSGAIETIEKIYSLLNTGGVLILTTPNAHHPMSFWSNDYTHVRPFPYHNLYGILKEAGFYSVEIFPYTTDKTKGLSRLIKRSLYHFMGFDFNTDMCFVGHK